MQKIMSAFSFLKKNKKIVFIVLAVVVILVVVFLFKNGNQKEETITANRSDFINQVSVSGKVIPAEDVNLAFKNGGMISRVYFKVGDFVKKGQIIAELNTTDAKGSLEIAKANYEKVLNGATSADVEVAKAQVEKAQVFLDQTKTQQALLVKNAKNNLLNSGFIATTDDLTSTKTPPTISGTYLKDTEGKIIIEEYDSSGGASFRTSGLVSAVGMVSAEIPQPVGDTGLYIKYPDTSDRTKWVVNIPNKESAQYLTNLNAYQSALSTETQNVANATAELNQVKASLALKQESARPEDISAAYGSLLVAQGSYDDKFIRAPFDGQITKIDAKTGEIASPNISLVSLISAGNFQIESFVPEVNISKIKLDDEANITLDAYGETAIFPAKVISIDPAETIRDGVSTYKIRLQFKEEDSRIKSGMTANILITVFSKPNAIILPEGVIFEKAGKKFVQIKKDRKISETEIITGSISSLGQVEIVSGISEGDSVVLNPIVK